MWYFSWVLGVGTALAFGVINVMWLESRVAARTAAGLTPIPAEANRAAKPKHAAKHVWD